MRSLLDNKFPPITFAWGFLEAPLEDLASFVSAWFESLSRSVARTPLRGRLEQALRHLDPVFAVPNKKLLMSTMSTWTACFENGKIGGAPASLVMYMAGQLKCRGLLLNCAPHTLSRSTGRGHGNWGAVTFELVGPRAYPNSDRAIWLANDGGSWTFGANGTPLPFEDVERYQRKEVQERFDSEMLEKYCRALGIDLFDEPFYGPDGVLLDVNERQPQGVGPVTLADVQSTLDLDKISGCLK